MFDRRIARHFYGPNACEILGFRTLPSSVFFEAMDEDKGRSLIRALQQRSTASLDRVLLSVSQASYKRRPPQLRMTEFPACNREILAAFRHVSSIAPKDVGSIAPNSITPKQEAASLFSFCSTCKAGRDTCIPSRLGDRDAEFLTFDHYLRI